MPFRTEATVDGELVRLNTTIHFLTFASMPSMIFEACKQHGIPSNSRYVQEAVCRRLADDMGYDYDELIAALPPGRRQARVFNGHRRPGPANTVEDVR